MPRPLNARSLFSLGIPIFANDPALEHLGSKSGSRHVFRDAGVSMPDGCEDLRDVKDMADGLVQLKRNDPSLRRATVKLEYGTSGEGNALFDFQGAPEGHSLHTWVTDSLHERLQVRGADHELGAVCRLSSARWVELSKRG